MANVNVAADEAVFAAGEVSADAGENNTLANTVIPGFDLIPVFDIRNGEVADARSVLVRPTIPAGYHWAPLGGVTPANAMRAVEGFIRCALAQAEAIPVATMGAEKRRKLAIVIGTARAVITAYYRIGTTNIIGGELGPTLLNVVTDANGDISYVVTVAQNDARRATLTANLELTEAERSVIAVLAMSSIGIPALQGWSLVMTGHHYISEAGNQSRRNVAVVEKQFWVSPSIQAWFQADMQDIQDWIWHKAGHPISMSLKIQLAGDERVARMLREAGAGSAAARLPALESPLRAAGSYSTLMETVGTLLKQVEGEVDMGFLPDIIYHIKRWPRDTPRLEDEDFNVVIPAACTSRDLAVAWLDDVLTRNRGAVAWCYGFYVALGESNAVNSGGRDTLKGSHSLEKLRGASFASYTEGYMAYADYSAMKTRMRTQGEFKAPRFSFTT